MRVFILSSIIEFMRFAGISGKILSATKWMIHASTEA